ncbi:MAG TPA: GNAT family N-acetyltransferase [Caulobacteraceae bacterium]
MIRPARLNERNDLIALQRRASLMWDEDRIALLEHPDAIDLPADQIAGGHVFVWMEAGEVWGFAVVLPREDGDAELDGLFVEPEGWGRAIGRRLVEHASEVTRQRGGRALNVVANKRALGFYLKCGFQVLGEVATRFSTGVGMVRVV